VKNDGLIAHVCEKQSADNPGSNPVAPTIFFNSMLARLISRVRQSPCGFWRMGTASFKALSMRTRMAWMGVTNFACYRTALLRD
jgi:hypothetical protein